MSKKHFIALAGMIREHNNRNPGDAFTEAQLMALAGFCADQNWQMRSNGGKVKEAA